MAKRPISRREARRQQLAQRRRRRQLMIGIPIAVVILLVLGLVLARSLDTPEIEGLQEYSGLSRGHDNAAQFEFTGLPPAGGVHFPRWLNCGVYREPVDTGLAVHSLEHGAVWLSYHPDLDPNEIATLEEYADNQNFVLISPFPNQSSDIVATAWGVQLELSDASDPRIPLFINQFVQQGPEPGATCANGVGTPIG